MKRYGNLFEKIIHKQNLLEAHRKARRGKRHYRDVQRFDQNLTKSINTLHDALKNKTFNTAPYSITSRIERGKERIIYRLPYNPDRVVHHALLQVIEPIIQETYIKDTYQSIRGRGVHKAKARLHDMMADREGTAYCLKMDIKKFYPSVDNDVMKHLIRRKIKCPDTLWLIDNIIDSAPGLPIGNYTSQTLGNYYLSGLDHFIKEILRVKYYIRYADDMVLLHHNKEHLHYAKEMIEAYLGRELKLRLKESWQVFPTYTRGLDFLGFRFFGTHTLLRKRTVKMYAALMRKIVKKGLTCKRQSSFSSYYGWIKAADAYNLLRTTITAKRSSTNHLGICNRSQKK
jgi:retron-type reverse transcriptase